MGRTSRRNIVFVCMICLMFIARYVTIVSFYSKCTVVMNTL